MTSGGLYLQQGGEGDPVLLLHGWSCHGGFFAGQVEALEGSHQVLVPDLPGHGRTGAFDGDLSIEAAADGVAELLDRGGHSNVTLCGWSMGAHVAYSLARRHGTARIARIIAIDMTPKVLNGPDWVLGSGGDLDAARNALVLDGMTRDWAAMAPRIAHRIFARDSGTDPELLAHTIAEIAGADPALLKPMWASLTAQDFRGFLSRDLDVPLHLCFGAQSQLYGPEVAAWHRAHVAGVDIRLFERSGHAPHLEERDAFNAWLLGLLG